MRMLTLIDEYTRECLAIRVARRLGRYEVIEALADMMLFRENFVVARSTTSWWGSVSAYFGGLRSPVSCGCCRHIRYPEDIQISTLPLRKGETLVEFKMTEDSTFVWDM